MNAFRIVPAGDSALIVEFEERIDPEVNARVVALTDRLNTKPVDGVRDVVPTYRSVAVYFDPLRTRHDDLVARLERDAALPAPPPRRAVGARRIPVCTPAIPTEPRGTRTRGESRRGAAIRLSTTPMYAKPGANPSMNT